MKAWHLVAVILVIGIYVVMRPPSAAKIARGLEVDLEANTIGYDGDVFSAEWGDSVTRTGDVRHVVRAHNKYAPIVLLHVVVTTGEFSDPDIVTIDHNGGGNYFWRSKKQPEGSLIVLHLVPETEAAFRTMRVIDEGDRVEIVGRDELRGSIESEGGGFLRLGHDNHKFVLVSRVTVMPT